MARLRSSTTGKLHLNGLDDNYFYVAINTIKTVSAEEVQQLANKYLVEEDFYELLVIWADFKKQNNQIIG